MWIEALLAGVSMDKSLRDIVLAYCDQYLTRDIKTVNFDTLMQFLSEYFD